MPYCLFSRRKTLYQARPVRVAREWGGMVARATQTISPVAGAALLCAAGFVEPALAQNEPYIPAPSNYGGVGLFDTRTARFLPDGYISATVSVVKPDDRYALTFQGLPWGEFSFRYAVDDHYPGTLHDRSFDAKFRLSREGEYIPEIALGFQDILGTGVYSGEYLVGSKRWGPFDLSLGMGWGRLASRRAFKNPLALLGDRFETRAANTGVGGLPLLDAYFHGADVGIFGGIAYETPIRNLTLKAEYSSDVYVTDIGGNYSFPINLGLSYRATPWLDVGLSYMHGRYIGMRFSTTFDAGADLWPARVDPPPRFRAREPDAQTLITPETGQATKTGTVETRFIDLSQVPAGAPVSTPALSPSLPPAAAPPAAKVMETQPETIARLKTALETTQLFVMVLNIEGETLKLAVENGRYLRDLEAIGRAARVLSAEAPAAIDFFEITVVRAGVPLTTVTLPRTQIDNLARRAGSTAEVLVGSDIKPASMATLANPQPNLFPRFGVNLVPIFRQSFFDPDHPVFVELGIGAEAFVELTRGWFVNGLFTYSLYDDFDQINRSSNSILPHVRSDIREYLQQGTNAIDFLASQYYFKVLPELYGRVTVGYLERMYGGYGGELLYRPFGKRWAIGVDVFQVRQRDYDVLFSFRSYQALTGHITAYYRAPWYDLLFSASYGQYLARDRGWTFQLSRRFATGIEVGAWFTLTNVSATQFGEGSFDKGIRIVIPFEWAAPYRTRLNYTLALRPIQRDGGQRLEGDMVLYDMTNSSDYGDFLQHWDSVFRR